MQAGGDSCLQQAISYSLLFALAFVLYTLMDGQNDGRLTNYCHEQNITPPLANETMYIFHHLIYL